MAQGETIAQGTHISMNKPKYLENRHSHLVREPLADRLAELGLRGTVGPKNNVVLKKHAPPDIRYF